MIANIGELVRAWDDELKTTTDGRRFNQLYERLLFSARQHYWQYLPTVSAERLGFEQRLARWIGALERHPKLQRILLELAGQVIYYAREDFDKLHQAALGGPIARWIVDADNLSFSAPDFDGRLNQAIHEDTWYCGLSDSMAIADFHHVNRIGGIDYRPDLRSLAKFSDGPRVIDFMQGHRREGRAAPLKKLVILEDFIGSGTQLNDASSLIIQLCQLGVPILLVPLVVCPEGDRTARTLVGRAGSNLRYCPVLSLDANEFVQRSTTSEESTLLRNVRRAATATYTLVKGNGAGAPLYGEFGFMHTGALIVMFSNAPANTLPLIQHESTTWTPLFPRSARVR